jgi:ubiquinone/menaquinone biosynthesis C-methylase UbiE
MRDVHAYSSKSRGRLLQKTSKNFSVAYTRGMTCVADDKLADWERRIDLLIATKGGSVSAAEFQKIVNVAFHDAEAASYDQVHDEIWRSSLPICQRLASAVPPSSGLDIADIGCGTGAASALLMQTTLAESAGHLLMVDTSSGMLERAKERHWSKPVEYLCGDVSEVESSSVDVVMVSSVLHHIPDLGEFCGHVRRILRPGGYFLHMHDPPRLAQPELPGRMRQFAQWQRRKRLASPSTWAKRLRRMVSHTPENDYVAKTNARLIAEGVIKTPLTPQEVWSITDLHNDGLPYSMGDKIDPNELGQGMHCLALFTYAFFGVLSSNLPDHLAKEESRLFAAGSWEGTLMAGAWSKTE